MERVTCSCSASPRACLCESRGMAEIELSVFSKQCLKGRLGDEETLRRNIRALERERNGAGVTIDWHFRSQDARVKLNRIYPKPKL